MLVSFEPLGFRIASQRADDSFQPFVEMASTGEVASFGKDLEEAYFLANVSINGFKLPKIDSGVLLGGDINKPELKVVAKELSDLGFKLYCSNNEVESYLNSIPHVVSHESRSERKLDDADLNTT